MNCHDARESFSEWADDALEPGARAGVAAHLADCGECRRELARFRDTLALLSRVERPRAPAGFAERVLRAIRPVARRRPLVTRLFFPLPVKLPAEAAAALLVAGLAVYAFQHTPALQHAARQEASRPMPPQPAGPAPAPAPPVAPPPTATPPEATSPAVTEAVPAPPSAAAPASPAPATASPAATAAPGATRATSTPPKAVPPAPTQMLPTPPTAAAPTTPAPMPPPPAATTSGATQPPPESPAVPPSKHAPDVTAGPRPSPPAEAPPSAPARSPATGKADARRRADTTSREPGSANAPAAESAKSAAAPAAPPAGAALPSTTGEIGKDKVEGAGMTRESQRDAARLAPAVERPRDSAGAQAKSASPPPPGAPRMELSAPTTSDVVGRLTVTDRRAAELALVELLARTRGRLVGRRDEGAGTLIDLVVPRASYLEFTQGLARIGVWLADSEPAALPANVRVALRLAE